MAFSKLDALQVLRAAFDDAADALKVSLTGTVAGGAEIIVDHTNDSIKLGDGTNLLTSTLVGGKRGLDVNVIAGGGGGGGSVSALGFQTRSDTFTATGAGVTVDCSAAPLKTFSLQVSKTGAVTSWTVVLEGSLDGVTWTTILTHADTSPGNGQVQSLGPAFSPMLYVRSRCSGLNLGGGTNVVATILGSQ